MGGKLVLAVFALVAILIGAVGSALILGVPVMYAWNYVVPQLGVGFREIGYIQAVVLYVLAALLFKSSGS